MRKVPGLKDGAGSSESSLSRFDFGVSFHSEEFGRIQEHGGKEVLVVEKVRKLATSLTHELCDLGHYGSMPRFPWVQKQRSALNPQDTGVGHGSQLLGRLRQED